MGNNAVNRILNNNKVSKLEELVSFKRGKNITSSEMSPGNIPVVSAGLDYSGYHNAWNVEGPSITISSSGANAGVVIFHNYNFWAADCLYAYQSKNMLFSYYFLKYLQPVIFNLQRGSAQPHVYSNNVNNLKVVLPSSNEQVNISKVLSNYDQLIENNNKRIKLLEEIAQQLYKEWFVRFRFPGHENEEFEEGKPISFRYVKIKDIYKFVRGISYSTEEIECEEGMNLVNLKNIQSFGGFRRDGLKKYSGDFKEEQIVSYNDLIMGVTDMTQDRRTVGSVALVPNIKGVISADLIKIESNLDSIFSYCLFRYGSYSKLISQFGNGVNVIHLRPQAIYGQKILLPKEELIKKFTEYVKPTIDEIENLYTKNENLAKQRDALLPRLMSGKISLEGKEII